MRLRTLLTMGDMGGICASGSSQPWKNRRNMRLRTLLTMGETG